MDFGTCVTNRNVCLCNEFINEFIYKWNDFSGVWLDSFGLEIAKYKWNDRDNQNIGPI